MVAIIFSMGSQNYKGSNKAKSNIAIFIKVHRGACTEDRRGDRDPGL